MEQESIVQVPQRRRQTLDLSALKRPASSNNPDRLRTASDAARYDGKPDFTTVSSPYSEYSRTIKLKARRGALRRKGSIRSHLEGDDSTCGDGSIASDALGQSIDCPIADDDDDEDALFHTQATDVYDNIDEDVDIPILDPAPGRTDSPTSKPPLPSSASSHMLRVLDERSLRRSLNNTPAKLAEVKFPRSFTQDYLDLSCLEESFDPSEAASPAPLAKRLGIEQRIDSPKVWDNLVDPGEQDARAATPIQPAAECSAVVTDTPKEDKATWSLLVEDESEFEGLKRAENGQTDTRQTIEAAGSDIVSTTSGRSEASLVEQVESRLERPQATRLSPAMSGGISRSRSPKSNSFKFLRGARSSVKSSRHSRDTFENSVTPETGDEVAIMSEAGNRELVLQPTNNVPVVMAGTTVSLLEHLLDATSVPILNGLKDAARREALKHHFEFVHTFLLTFRSFVSQETLLQVMLKQAHNSAAAPHVMDLLFDWIDLAWFEFEQDRTLMDLLRHVVAVSEAEPSAQPRCDRLKQRMLECAHAYKQYASIIVLEKPSVSLVMVTGEQLAEQLTLYNANLFSAIKPVELCSAILQNVNGRSLLRLIKRFDLEYFWIEQQVLCCQDPKLQAMMLEKFIHAGTVCRTLNNYFSSFTIAGGLDTPDIRRLKAAWELVPKDAKKQLTKLLNFTSTDRNMKAYRSAVKKLDKKSPRVLFLPLLMKDMRFLADGNPKKIDGLHNYERLRILGRYADDLCDQASVKYKKLEHNPELSVFIQYEEQRTSDMLQAKQFTPADPGLPVNEARLQAQVNELTTSLEERADNMVALQSTLDQLREDHQQSLAQAKAQADDQLTMLNAVVDSLKQEITKLREDNKHLRTDANASSLPSSPKFAPPAIPHQLPTGAKVASAVDAINADKPADNDPHAALVRTASRLSALERAYEEARGRKASSDMTTTAEYRALWARVQRAESRARELEYDNAALRSLLASNELQDDDIDAELEAARSIAQQLSAVHQAEGLANISQVVSASPRRRAPALSKQQSTDWLEWSSNLDVSVEGDTFDALPELSASAIQASLRETIAVSPRRASLLQSTTLDLDSQASSGRASPRSATSPRTSAKASPRASAHSGALSLDGTDNWLSLDELAPVRSPRSSHAQPTMLSAGVTVDRAKAAPRYSQTFSTSAKAKETSAMVADV
eukprot:m.59687 g.59687  ORF g.59687 m.59687 type:complete len:1185 (+) comp13822_c0_seq1:86-3640(+)